MEDIITRAAVIRYVVEAAVSITAVVVHHRITQQLPVSAVVSAVTTSETVMVTVAAAETIIKLPIIPISPTIPRPCAATSVGT